MDLHPHPVLRRFELPVSALLWARALTLPAYETSGNCCLEMVKGFSRSVARMYQRSSSLSLSEIGWRCQLSLCGRLAGVFEQPDIFVPESSDGFLHCWPSDSPIDRLERKEDHLYILVGILSLQVIALWLRLPEESQGRILSNDDSTT